MGVKTWPGKCVSDDRSLPWASQAWGNCPEIFCIFNSLLMRTTGEAQKIELLAQRPGENVSRTAKVVAKALERSPGRRTDLLAYELDGVFEQTTICWAYSAASVNVLKELAGWPRTLHVISSRIHRTRSKLKVDYLAKNRVCIRMRFWSPLRQCRQQ